MVTCQECGRQFRVITHKHLKFHNLTVAEYTKKYPDAKLYGREFFAKASASQTGKKMGDDNPARRKEVREKISNSVAKRWDEGNYDNRVNGMTGICGELHPNWKEENHTLSYLAEHKYVDFLAQYQDVTVCSKCGCSVADGRKINVHHIDEDRSNFLPSNLEPLCIPCHSSVHYSKMKTAFITVGKQFTFASAHRLPEYNGPCFNWHGHEWSLEIRVRKRINKETGMVIDFSDLKTIVNTHVISKLDHSCINDVIENPTAENMLVWIWEVLTFEALLKGIEEISLWETPTSKATLDKAGMLSLVRESIENYVKGDLL